MHKYLILLLPLFISSCKLYSQQIPLTKTNLTPVQVFMKNVEMDGKKAIRVTKDTAVTKDDESTFVRIICLSGMEL
jgi:hypothetical protein